MDNPINVIAGTTACELGSCTVSAEYFCHYRSSSLSIKLVCMLQLEDMEILSGHAVTLIGIKELIYINI